MVVVVVGPSKHAKNEGRKEGINQRRAPYMLSQRTRRTRTPEPYDATMGYSVRPVRPEKAGGVPGASATPFTMYRSVPASMSSSMRSRSPLWMRVPLEVARERPYSCPAQIRGVVTVVVVVVIR